MKNNIKEIILTISIIILAVLLLNPFDFWMPNMLLMCMLVTILGLFGLFAGLILREKSEDERDDVHKALAGRNAFLTGSVVIIIAIVVQGYNHIIDPWLVLALISMITTKVLTRIWTDKNL
jgi:uncharacterized membrane protein